MLLDNFSPMIGAVLSKWFDGVYGGNISMGARREVASAVTERYRSAKQAEKGRILDELRATTGSHRKHEVRVLRDGWIERPSSNSGICKRVFDTGGRLPGAWSSTGST